MQNNQDLFFSAGIDVESLKRDAERIKAQINNLSSHSQKESSAMSNAFKQVGSSIAAAFSIQQASAFIREMIAVRSEMQSLEVSFTTLLGSADKAKELFSELKDFAVSTPMQMQDLAKGAQTLLSFGYEADKVMPILRAIGDISLGNSEKFNSLTLAFAQASSTGKLMGQDFLQMINAGFNPLSIIAEKTGKSIAELKEEMSAGAISSEMLSDAFLSATAEGGKYHGMLKSLSGTLQGSISNLQGHFNDMLNEIAESNASTITSVISFSDKLIQNYKAIWQVLSTLIAVYGTYKAVLIATATYEKVLAQLSIAKRFLAMQSAIQGVTKAQAALNVVMSANPLGAVASAIALVVGALVYFANESSAAEQAQASFNDSQKEFLSILEERRNKADALLSTIQNENESEYAKIKALETLKQLYPETFKNMDLQTAKTLELADANKKLNDETAKQEVAGQKDKLEQLRKLREEYEKIQKVQPIETREALKDGLADRIRKELTDVGWWEDIVKSNEYFFETLESLYQKQKEVTENAEKTLFDSQPFEKKAPIWKTQLEETDEAIRKTEEKIQKMKDRVGSNPWNIDISFKFSGYQTMLETLLKKKRELEGKLNPETPADDESKTVKNYNYWSAKKEELQSQKKALVSNSTEFARLNKEIAKVDKELARYSDSTHKAGGQTKDFTKILLEARESLNDFALKLEQETREKRLELEKDGLNKSLELNRLAHEKRLAQIEEESEKLLDLKRKEAEAEYYKKTAGKGKFDSSKVQLSEEEKARFSTLAKISAEKLAKDNQEALDRELSNLRSYEEKKLAIQEEYMQKRRNLVEKGEDGGYSLRAGVSSAHLQNLDKQEKEAFERLNEETASKMQEYQDYLRRIASISQSELKAYLDTIEREVQKKKLLPNLSAEQKVLYDELLKHINELRKNNNLDISPKETSIKKWQDMQKTLSELSHSFEDIGAKIGGVLGEVISEAGAISASIVGIINGIVQFSEISSKSIEGTAQASATAIKMVEGASVVLAIISATLSIVQQITAFFDKKHEARAKAIREEIALQSALNTAIHEQALAYEKAITVFGKMDYNKLNHSVSQMNKYLKGRDAFIDEMGKKLGHYDIGNTREDWKKILFSVRAGFMTFEEGLKKLKDPWWKPQTSMPNRVKFLTDEMNGYRSYQKMIAELIDEDGKINEAKLKQNARLTNEMKEEIRAYAKVIADAKAELNDFLEGLFGEIASSLADDLVNAFKLGKEAGADFASSIAKSMEAISKKMLMSSVFGATFDNYSNRMKELFSRSGRPEEKTKQLAELMGEFSLEVKAGMNDFNSALTTMSKAFRENGIDALQPTKDEDKRRASEKGLAQASQDSINELNGRLTAIQSHTYNLNKNVEGLRADSSALLRSVLNIERSTARLSNVERDLGEMAHDIQHIKNNGIKIK